MPLTQDEYTDIRRELDDCARPLILHHDDADGLCSYLLLKRYKGAGTGVMVKPTPVVDSSYLQFVERFNPDKVFIVDIAIVEQEFIDACPVPVIWIDHHQPLKRNGVKYFNPRMHSALQNEPATYLCFHSVKQDLWIAMVGIVGDWHLTDVAAEFSAHYPDLLPKSVTQPPQALFDTPVGTLVRIFTFIMKGTDEEALENIRLLETIQSPEELLEQKSEAAKHVFAYYEKYQKKYDEVLAQALAVPSEDNFTVFIYEGKDSFTSELSNEMLYRRPDNVIVLARPKGGKMRVSLRGAGKNIILPRLEAALTQVRGNGGGHEYACGASIEQDDFEKFLTVFKKQFQ